MGAVHQPNHQLMGGDGEIKISLGMTGKTKLTLPPLHRCSDPIPAEFVGVSLASGHRTPPLQCATPQDLQGCGKILLATDATAVGSEQNQLGGI